MGRLLWLAAGAIVALWLGTIVLGLTLFDDWEQRGQFGDLFGSVNSLFSGLAFLGVIAAILLQRQELSLQRAELKLQREEMAASRAELAAQVKAQYALVAATIAQIRVAAMQAEMESWKMEAEGVVPGARDRWVKQMLQASRLMHGTAEKLEKQVSERSK